MKRSVSNDLLYSKAAEIESKEEVLSGAGIEMEALMEESVEQVMG